MEAGGKIEDGESPVSALRRELSEEIRLVVDAEDARHLGCYSAPAANEPGHTVDAEIFHVRTRHDPAMRSEIEETFWVDHAAVMALPLAPLTRGHILPLSRAL